MPETSTKPYLIRALHDWCTDNGYTPHIVVQVDENTVVPMDYVQDGQITLNISYLSTNQLLIGNEYIEFQARFGGTPEDIFVPVAAVSAIFARETGAGMGFEVTESEPYPGSSANKDEPSQSSTSEPQTKEDEKGADSTNKKAKDDKGGAGHLRIIK
ncbi:MAG TPA: ClpXP protease specificity-enhancing factor [Paenalcaligenes sp.]|nr:ClpXP protease specificity-enhancing factor [Paenalcaligenes sp.]